MGRGILLVDDEAALLANLATYLDSFGDRYSVRTAGSGMEAIEILSADLEIGVLVTDIRMPGIDGIELVRWCFRQRRSILIVVMTAYGSSAVREVVLRNGALRFLEKPIDLDVFESTMRSLVDEPLEEDNSIVGLELVDVVRFVAATGATRVLSFHNQNRSGLIGFEYGRLVHCSTESCFGCDAFFEMTLWGMGHFSMISEAESVSQRRNIEISTMSLLEEAVRFRDVVDSQDVVGGGSRSVGS